MVFGVFPPAARSVSAQSSKLTGVVGAHEALRHVLAGDPVRHLAVARIAEASGAQ